MTKFLTIHEAADLLGVSPQTLRRWERAGKITCAHRTKGNRPTLAYARVSSHDQKEDLERQEHMLSLFWASKGWEFEILSDLGSGLNYHKRGLKQLITKILNKNICRLVLTHRDRLLRFGSELIFAICEEKGLEVVIINQGKEPSFEEELASDVDQ